MIENIYSQTFSVEGKVIALIGATGILGRQYVYLLANAGAKLAIGDIDLQSCQNLAGEVHKTFGAECIALEIDITNVDHINNFFTKVNKKYRKIDVLINNAQVKPEGFYASFENYKKETLMSVLDGNLAGVVLVCQQACKEFVTQGYGNIINVSSIYGNVGADQRLYDGVKNIYYPDEQFSSPVSYAISKAGVVNFTRYLASYYRDKNIRVNCLTPGGVFDDHDETFNRNYSYRTLLGRMADRNEYKGAILFLASEASSYMTGANLIVDGGWTAI